MAEKITQGGIRIALIMGDSEQAGELAFKVAERPEAGSGGVEMIEGPHEQIVQVGIRVFRFDRRFEEPAAVGGEQDRGVGLAQAFPPVADGDLAQGVELTATGALKGDLAGEKQVELPGEGAFGAAGAASHGLHKPMFRGEPVDDEAGVREPGEADEDGRRGLLHSGESWENRWLWRWKTGRACGWRFPERFPEIGRIVASDPFAKP